MQMEIETKRKFKEVIERTKSITDKDERSDKLAELRNKIELYNIAVQLCYPQAVKDKLFKADSPRAMERIMHDARLA